MVSLDVCDVVTVDVPLLVADDVADVVAVELVVADPVVVAVEVGVV